MSEDEKIFHFSIYQPVKAIYDLEYIGMRGYLDDNDGTLGLFILAHKNGDLDMSMSGAEARHCGAEILGWLDAKENQDGESVVVWQVEAPDAFKTYQQISLDVAGQRTWIRFCARETGDDFIYEEDGVPGHYVIRAEIARSTLESFAHCLIAGAARVSGN